MTTPTASDGAAGAPVDHVSADTVEAVVRAQLAQALGGRRGMLEAAVPTVGFTATYLLTRDIPVAVGVSVSAALALLALRLVQRGPLQYVVNSLVGIGVGCLFVWLGGRNGGDESHQALAYFAPGLLYNAGYGVAMVLSIVTRWPLVGLIVGSMSSDDPTGWRRDPQVVRLCSRLTWLLVLPCLARVAVQGPLYLAGRAADDADPYVTALGIAKIAMGWPLQVAALLAMLWLLARGRTPVEGSRVAVSEQG